MSLAAHCLDIEGRLAQKYQNPFAFYRVKQINDMLYGHFHRQAFIELCDVRALADNTEYMRRAYYFRTLTGREELLPRIRMCCDYYSKNQLIMHEYPMMIVTNTKTLFLKRNRRLRKIINGEASSDDSNLPDEEHLLEQHEQTDLLPHLSNNSLDDLDYDSEPEDLDYDSEEHDAFQHANSSPPTSQLALSPTDHDVAHLVLDMGSDGSTQTQQVLVQRVPPLHKSSTLQNIQNKLPVKQEQSISIYPEEGTRPSHQPKLSISTSFSHELRQKTAVSFSKLCSTFENQVEEAFRSSPGSLKAESGPAEDCERQQLQAKRRKIRQKAQELLKKVRKQGSLTNG